MSNVALRFLATASIVLFSACAPEAPPASSSTQDSAATGAGAATATDARATAPPPAPEEPTSVTPTEVRADAIAIGADRDASGAATNAKPRYTTSDTVYASVPTQGIAAGAKLDAYWTYENGQTHKMDSQTAPSNGNATFMFSPADGLRAGNYNVQIDANGIPLGIVEFRVE